MIAAEMPKRRFGWHVIKIEEVLEVEFIAYPLMHPPCLLNTVLEFERP